MLLLAAALSIVVGVTLGLLGGGGAILTVPMLVYVLGVDAKVAVATSLLVVAVTSVSGVTVHAMAGVVRWRVGLILGITGMVGAFVGGRLAGLVSGTVLLVAFGALMLVMSIAMMRGRGNISSEESKVAWGVLAAIGLAVGATSGFLGAGGGFLIVPALTLVARVPVRNAIGTSLFVIAMQTAAGFASHVMTTQLDWTLAFVVTGAAVLGSFAGAKLAHRVDPKQLRKGFGVFVLVMALFLLGKESAPYWPEGTLAHVLVVITLVVVGAAVLFLGLSSRSKRHPGMTAGSAAL